MRRALQPRSGRGAQAPAPRRSNVESFPAPVRGLVTNQNLSKAPKMAALVLDNWFPTQTGIRPRGGTALHATLPSGVKSMWTYQAGLTRRVFAATETDIYDITAPADPEAAPDEDLSGLAGGDWTMTQFETSGGVFLVGVNGLDTPKQYSAGVWTDSTINGSGLTPSRLSHAWPYKNRLFFIESGTMKVWYLPVGSITGTALQFSLAGVFGKGGSLLFGATWSLDAGNGINDLCVLVSTLGEVAIYQGTDPSNPANWAIVGRFEISQPLGKHATISAGGDLLIATAEGIVPLSEVIKKDPAALSVSAVTRNIEPDWNAAVRLRSGLPWTLHKFTLRNMLIVGMPSPEGAAGGVTFVANIETGAWCRFTGAPWNIRAQAEVGGVHYVASESGLIHRTETGGSDDGMPYISDYVGHFDHLGSRGPMKSITLARASFRATRAFIAKVSGSVDYTVSLPAAPNSVSDSVEDAWDEGLWDQAVWDGSGTALVVSGWQAIAAAGFVFAPQVQITSGITPRPAAELMSVDVMYETGAVVV